MISSWSHPHLLSNSLRKQWREFLWTWDNLVQRIMQALSTDTVKSHFAYTLSTFHGKFIPTCQAHGLYFHVISLYPLVRAQSPAGGMCTPPHSILCPVGQLRPTRCGCHLICSWLHLLYERLALIGIWYRTVLISSSCRGPPEFHEWREIGQHSFTGGQLVFATAIGTSLKVITISACPPGGSVELMPFVAPHHTTSLMTQRYPWKPLYHCHYEWATLPLVISALLDPAI